VPGCGAAVRSGTIRTVRSAEVFSDGDVVVIGTIRVTTLHPRGSGSSELPPPPFARGSVTLVGEFLEGNVQGRQPTVDHSYEDDA
jgi:hypothetical protein